MDQHMPSTSDAGFEGRANGKQAREQDVGVEEDGGERRMDHAALEESIVARRLLDET